MVTLSAPEQLVPSEALLEAAATGLGFSQGELLVAEAQLGNTTPDQWLEKGDWLALAKYVGAERVFFVDQNPVVVFARLDDQSDNALRVFYNRIWCMARPQLLFLARPGELAIYDLGKAPIRPGERADDRGRLLSQKVKIATEVQAKLSEFRREEIESGRLWEDSRFARGADRADRALIRDLRVVHEALLARRLKAKYAHALIGRSIFVRYLEDRKVLVPEYFKKVAAQRKTWTKLLTDSEQRPFAQSDLASLCYPRVLEDKDFTYALFDQLAKDFNGDIFPVDEEERQKVEPEHLALLRGLLLGETAEQQQLFFFAYRFDVIPIELISSIYEEFYNEEKGKDKNHGPHYTPSTLVEFILARSLTPEVLERSPRVTNFACGSGIFLVESFRRIVRYQVRKQNGKRLSRSQLRKIVRDQIAGIDINEEAVRVSAFSLYLAFLHYQEPREINEQRQLPNLKWAKRAHTNGEQHFDVLLRREAKIIGKGKKERTVFFTDRALGWIKRYLESRTDDYPALFVCRNGRTRLKRDDLWRYFERHRRLVGINKKVTPHILRHTAATQLLFNGCPIGHIKEILGHERLETTCRYYLGLDRRAAKAAHQKYLRYDVQAAAGEPA